MAHQMKDPKLSLQWLGSLPWHGFNSWPRNFHMLQVQPPPKAFYPIDQKKKFFFFYKITVIGQILRIREWKYISFGGKIYQRFPKGRMCIGKETCIMGTSC